MTAGKKSEPDKTPGPGFTVDSRSEIRGYFRKLKVRLKAGLFIAIVMPVALLSIYFHVQFNYSLKESGKLHLSALAESQKNTVDLFLQERVVNIFSLFLSSDFSLRPTEDDMESYLRNLRQVSDAFIDVGFFDSKGVQIGYAGPYPYLHGKDYSGETWFTTLLDQENNYYISDIYFGFRNKPHFTIAVKQLIDGRPYVMRASLDPDKFYIFLRTISRGKGVDSVIIDDEGHYQVVDPEKGEVLAKSDFMPSRSQASGVQEVGQNGDSTLVAHAWLTETPWVLVVRQPLKIAYARMYRTRSIIIASTVVIIMVIAAVIWIAVDNLMDQAQATAESRKELQTQLLHASKLASVGELAAGIAHEINNPLAIIMAESGVIRDMLDPEIPMEGSPEEMRKELDNIDNAVFRARGITQKLLNFARKEKPKLEKTSLNKLLDNVVGGFLERELMVSNIKLIRDYDGNLPKLMLDPDQISQVFLNLVNNASDAIDGSGSITLSTRREDEAVRVTVTDTGKGMEPEQMKKIFLPFFTTKEVGKGTGLGLSVSLSIVESFGGTIEVQSMPGAGSSFSVILPISKPGDM